MFRLLHPGCCKTLIGIARIYSRALTCILSCSRPAWKHAPIEGESAEAGRLHAT
jgi:hypothetical protein